MSIFDKERGQVVPEALEQPEHPDQVHLIGREYTEIDLAQPEHTRDYAVAGVTGYEGCKVVAEIMTPRTILAISVIQFEGADPVITIAGADAVSPSIVNPGESLDFSDFDSTGACIISVDSSGHHVFIHAEQPDARYTIATRILRPVASQSKIPAYEDSVDDPEFPYESLA